MYPMTATFTVNNDDELRQLTDRLAGLKKPSEPAAKPGKAEKPAAKPKADKPAAKPKADKAKAKAAPAKAEKADDDDAPSVTKDDVRAAFLAAKKKGADIRALFAEFDARNLHELKESDYAAAIKAAKAATE